MAHLAAWAVAVWVVAAADVRLYPPWRLRMPQASVARSSAFTVTRNRPAFTSSS